MRRHSSRNRRLGGLVLQVVLCVAVLTSVTWAQEPPSAEPKSAEPASEEFIRYRLKNVTIPENSPLRLDSKLNHPPKMYIRIQRNGRYYKGKSSSGGIGWENDFPDNEEDNYWDIRLGSQDRYTVEVWDNQWSDELIFKITKLRASAFDELIYQNTDSSVDKSRRATIEFERAPPVSKKP